MPHQLSLGDFLGATWAITPEALEALSYIAIPALTQGNLDKFSAGESRTQLTAEQGQLLHMRSGANRADVSFAVAEGKRLQGTRYVTQYDNGVAVASLVGPIFPRANVMTMISDAVSIDLFAKDIVTAFNDPTVKGIVLDIDSPGGDVRKIGSSSQIIHALAQSDKKPMVSFASGLMASAAYYVGSAVGAKNIYGDESASFGSIGVLLTVQANDKGAFEIVAAKSPNKRPDPSTEEGREMLRQRADDMLEVFLKDVANFRGITIEKVLTNYGQGSVFVGSRAKAQGLVDKISTLGEVVKMVEKQSTRPKTFGYAKAAAEYIETKTDEELEAMGFKDKFMAFMANEDDEVTPTADPTANADGGQANEALVFQLLTDTPREDIEAQAAEKMELVTKNLVLSGKIVPAEQATAFCELVAASCDDQMFGGKVTFVGQDGKEQLGTREEAAMARYEGRKSHNLTKQAIPATTGGNQKTLDIKVLDENNEPPKARQTGEDVEMGEPIAEDRMKALLAKTEDGRKALSANK